MRNRAPSGAWKREISTSATGRRAGAETAERRAATDPRGRGRARLVGMSRHTRAGSMDSAQRPAGREIAARRRTRGAGTGAAEQTSLSPATEGNFAGPAASACQRERDARPLRVASRETKRSRTTPPALPCVASMQQRSLRRFLLLSAADDRAMQQRAGSGSAPRSGYGHSNSVPVSARIIAVSTISSGWCTR
jgi:hypothetical protein